MFQQKKDNVVMLNKARGMEHVFPLPKAMAPIITQAFYNALLSDAVSLGEISADTCYLIPFFSFLSICQSYSGDFSPWAGATTPGRRDGSLWHRCFSMGTGITGTFHYCSFQLRSIIGLACIFQKQLNLSESAGLPPPSRPT
jgi:hypothetical protein